MPNLTTRIAALRQTGVRALIQMAQIEGVQIHPGGGCLWSWNLKLPANTPDSSFLDFTVARHAGDLPVGRIEPDRVRTALAKENASPFAQVPLRVAELHASANSSGSRRALGERSFSASSRWHSSTSLSASRRFALASSRVSPCEMAAGTSSTTQVYPPSLAGSKTPVNFMSRGYCPAPPLASGLREANVALLALNTDEPRLIP